MNLRPRFPLACGLVSAALSSPILLAQNCPTTIASRGPGGQDVAASSQDPVISRDGRFVGWVSFFDGVTLDDVNGAADVFLHDRQTGATELVSKSSTGVPGNGDSYLLEISADGRWVAFSSDATNLAAGDGNSDTDAFVRDLASGQTTRLSLGLGGAATNGASFVQGISADGSLVVFWSQATNLVAGDSNGCGDIFVVECATGQIRRVSVGSAGAEADSESYPAAISGDGRFVVFSSYATTLVAGDTNAFADVFLHELASGTTTRLSLGPGGLQGNGDSRAPAVSADGRHVAFESAAYNLVPGDVIWTDDVFVLDRTAGTLLLASVSPLGRRGAQGSYGPWLAADGSCVSFCTADALEAGDTNGVVDVYVRATSGPAFGRVSYGADGLQAFYACLAGAISDGGAVAVFASDDPTLVPNDAGVDSDVFVRPCAFPPVPVYTSSCSGDPVDCPCANPGDGYGGCDNSQGTAGAELAAHGWASLNGDTLRLSAWRLPDNVPALFLQAQLTVAGTSWGDGLGCLGGGTNRLGIRFANLGTVGLGHGLAGSPLLSLSSGLPPTGGTRTYQVVYRNPAVFCTGATFNTTNSIEVVWAP